MTDKLTDEQVADLLTTLRSDAVVDAKVAAVIAAKSAIKQHNVPDTCIPPLFEALRLASQAQHAVLINAGFSSLSHLLTRLSRQEPKWVSKEAGRTLPLIVEKMGDQKEKFRTLAAQAMTTIYKVSPTDAERFVRNIAMSGKNPRAKESALHWVLQRHQEDGLQFRSYVPQLMELLEDADAMVRDAAKQAVIELFRNASGPAKSDLKKQLKNFKVRPAIEQAIVKELIPGGADRPESRAASRAGSAPPSRPNLSASVSSMASERPITPLVPDRPESVDPSYVNTLREFDEIIRDMHVFFEGRESEQNWLKREESILKLRRLLGGNASSDYPDQFITHLRSLLDGIIKAVTSLRTSLSKEGCSLVQEISLTFGSAMDPMVELLLQTFIKLCASTKKIASQSGNITVDMIVGRATYTTRIMQHIWSACQDKNVQPRTYAAGWLKTVLKKEANHKSHVEHGGGLDLVEKCINKGLNDPNPGVREKMRGAFWLFHGIWTSRADTLMNKLDGTAQKLLLKDVNNPNSPPAREPAAGARSGLGLSKSTMGASSKPSLRETLMAQKRAALISKKAMPQRPGSAMAHFSPVRVASNTSTTSTSTSSTTATSSSTIRGLAHSGVSGAPVRPTRKRPEVAARPATAGPYSVRGHDAPGSHDGSSPIEPKPRTRMPKTLDSSPKRTVGRRPAAHAPHASEPTLPSPAKPVTQSSAHSPRNTPRMRPLTTASSLHSSSPSRPDEKALEEFTLVVPTILPPKSHRPVVSVADNGLSPVTKEPEEVLQYPVQLSPVVHIRQETPVPLSPIANTPSKTVKVYEDPFISDQVTPRSQTIQSPPLSVLEDKPINENAAPIANNEDMLGAGMMSPDKSRQNSKLLDSGITRVKAKSLDVHGLRKLQSVIRDNKAPFSDEKFDALLMGLFEYLESTMPNTTPDKAQDVKAQILSTVKLLLKKSRDNFQPHVSRGLEALLMARSGYDSHTHIVSGLELLADELVTLGDASEIVMTMTRKMKNKEMDTEGCRSLSMGLHVLKEMIDARVEYRPSGSELDELSTLAGRCLESVESGVRMDAVQLCVALHSRLGEPAFWDTLRGVKDDPKSLITYYVVKRQRERDAAAVAASAA